MTFVDPALPISGTADQRAVTGRVDTLTRRLQFVPTVLPHVIIGGTPRPDGYQSVDSTTFVEIARVDCWVTGPYLDYDVQVTDTHGGTATSIDWQIDARFPSTVVADTVVASGTGVTGTQFTAVVDLFTALGQVVFSEFMSLRLEVKRTGGSGEAAGIRLVKPWLIRATPV